MSAGLRWTEEELERFYARAQGKQRTVEQLPANARIAERESNEERLWRQLRRLRGVRVVREHLFHPVRAWRFDFAIPSKRIAIEVEGGIQMLGRHQRPDGFVEDCRKYNSAALAGWRVLRFAPVQIASGEAAEMIALAIEKERRK